MNIVTSLPFLQSPPNELHLFDDEDARYAKGYGNRIASERFFAPLGHARAALSRFAAEEVETADLAIAGCA